MLSVKDEVKVCNIPRGRIDGKNWPIADLLGYNEAY